MQNFIADRMDLIGTETAFEMLAKANQLESLGRNIIHLEIGEPDFQTPRHIVDAGIEAIRCGFTRYTPAPGLEDTRRIVAEYVSRTRNISVSPEEVVIVPGGKPIMFFAALATVNPDDEVIYPNPGFPIYESVIRFAGGRPVPLPLREERDFRLDVDELRSHISPKTRMIILNSPHNPTGSVLTPEDLQAIADIVRERNILVLSDEIYEKIIYGDPPQSIASLPGMKEKTIILNGFSKSYAMTGWRLGYGVMNREIAQQMTKLVINNNSCVPGFVQSAGIAALTGPQEEVALMVDEFKRRRDVMVAGLNSIPGITCITPPGAFYTFPNAKRLGMPSRDLANFLLEEAGVATLGGSAFGVYGEGYLRLSFANSLENLHDALERIRRVVEHKLRP